MADKEKASESTRLAMETYTLECLIKTNRTATAKKNFSTQAIFTKVNGRMARRQARAPSKLSLVRKFSKVSSGIVIYTVSAN